MKKKISQFKWLATTLLLVAAMVMPSVAWAYNQPNGKGTKESPYQISSGDELYWFAAYVNGDPGKENGNYTACAVLTQDISVSGEWTPIMGYSGTFDGNGHTISGLQKTISGGGGCDIGLFGITAEGSVICNVGIVNCIFSLIGGGGSVGGVCGQNKGTIKNCYNTGKVDGTPGQVGGICGTNNGTIKNCYNTGSVYNGQESGGVCGLNCENGTITNCYYLSGTATGGIYDGTGSAEVKDATQFASGEVAWLLNGERSEGAEENPLAWYQNIGVDSYPVLDSSHKTVYCGYKDCILSYSNTQEGLSESPVHNYNNGICKACNVYQPATLTTDQYDINGDNTKDNVYEIGNAGQLYWFAGLVNGDASVCNYDATSNPTGTQQNTAACALLTANITVNSSLKENLNADGTVKDGYVVRSWTPIGGYYNKKDVYYNGIFDGNSKTIRGLYYGKSVSETYNLVGLFGQNKEIIKNVGIEDSYFKIDCNDNYVVCYVGGLCGFNQGTIENCDNASIVSVTETTQPTGAFVGGVCGDNVGGKIINCNNAGEVSSTVSLTYDNCVGGVSGANFQNSIIENSSNKGIVSGTNNVGGVCGLNCSNLEYKVTIKKCHNEGNVSGTNNVGGVCGNNGYYNLVNVSVIENCYNTGAVSGTSDVGGVSGINKGVEAGEPSIVTNCYNTGVVKGTSSVGGVVGGIYGSGVVNIINCYYLEGCSAKGTTFTRTEGTSKTADKFENGEVCYLLNGEKSKVTDENPLVWYQNIDNGTLDAYPLLDSNGHGTVYASAPCPSKFSNTNNLSAEEHANEYTVSEEDKSISAKCSKCGHDRGTITLTVGTTTYDGQPHAATVDGTIEGATTSVTYQTQDGSDLGTSVPTNAGTYKVILTCTDADKSYAISAGFEISKAVDAPNRPTELNGGYAGESLSTVSLDDYPGWSWDNPNSTLPNDCGSSNTYQASYMDQNNYENRTAEVSVKTVHKYENGICSICDAYQPAELTTGKYDFDGNNDTKDEVYEIGNAGQLYWFAGLVNGTLEGVTRNKSANAVLTDNITVNKGVLDTNGEPKSASFRNWTPIGVFELATQTGYNGTFDGNNKTISGLYFNDTTIGRIGLFGAFTGIVKNVGVVDSYFNGLTLVGGVCGYAKNGIITNCYNNSTVIGGNKVGGICGENDINVKIINCYNLGAVSGTTNIGGMCGLKSSNGTITNCYYLSGTATGGINGADAAGSAESKSLTQFASGEVAYLLNEGKAFGTQVWGQLLGVNDYPVLGSDYKVIRAAKGDMDAIGDYPYWATFSNQSGDSDLGGMNVYTAKVSNGVLAITRCSDKIVAKGEGVLIKGSAEYLNAKMLNTTSATAEANNDLVATPDETQIIYADSGHKLYRLTYKSGTSDLGFYWGLVKNDVGSVISDDGSQLKATPNKAYLDITTAAATGPFSAAPARGFAFPSDGETTGIECITITDDNLYRNGNAEGIFDLQGRKVSKPTKGVYIKNNKLFLN